MEWSPRMQDVVDADWAWRAEHGRLPTLVELGAALGLSRERVRQIRARIERYRSFPRQHDEHVKRWRHLFTEALAAIRKAVASKQVAVRLETAAAESQSRAAVLKLLRKFAGFAERLSLLGPHRTWPRWQKQEPGAAEVHRQRRAAFRAAEKVRREAEARAAEKYWAEVEKVRNERRLALAQADKLRRKAIAQIKALSRKPPLMMWDRALREATANGWAFVGEGEGGVWQFGRRDIPDEYWPGRGGRPYLRWMVKERMECAEADWRARRLTGDPDLIVAWERAF